MALVIGEISPGNFLEDGIFSDSEHQAEMCHLCYVGLPTYNLWPLVALRFMSVSFVYLGFYL